MAKAFRDTETDDVYHPDCVPNESGFIEVDVDGEACKECGELIADDEDTPTHEEEDD